MEYSNNDVEPLSRVSTPDSFDFMPSPVKYWASLSGPKTASGPEYERWLGYQQQAVPGTPPAASPAAVPETPPFPASASEVAPVSGSEPAMAIGTATSSPPALAPLRFNPWALPFIPSHFVTGVDPANAPMSAVATSAPTAPTHAAVHMPSISSMTSAAPVPEAVYTPLIASMASTATIPAAVHMPPAAPGPYGVQMPPLSSMASFAPAPAAVYTPLIASMASDATIPAAVRMPPIVSMPLTAPGPSAVQMPPMSSLASFAPAPAAGPSINTSPLLTADIDRGPPMPCPPAPLDGSYVELTHTYRRRQEGGALPTYNVVEWLLALPRHFIREDRSVELDVHWAVKCVGYAHLKPNQRGRAVLREDSPLRGALLTWGLPQVVYSWLCGEDGLDGGKLVVEADVAREFWTNL